jgi:solute carrier family 25 protein 44
LSLLLSSLAGYWLTLMHNAPLSAMVWGTYGSVHPLLRQVTERVHRFLSPASASDPTRLHPALRKWDALELGTVFISAGVSAAVASTVTLPLDVIKVRLQASRDPQATVRSTWRALIAERGILGLSSGLNARLASAVPTSALLMVTFEALKRATIRADAEPHPMQLQQHHFEQ